MLSVGYHAESQLKGLLAGSGVVAIILGFAGQNFFAGIIAGMSIQLNRPYKVGDWLKIGDTYGEVREINWRSTRLCTNDTIYLDIPNNEIVKSTIINLSYPTEIHVDADPHWRRLQRATEPRERCTRARRDRMRVGFWQDPPPSRFS